MSKSAGPLFKPTQEVKFEHTWTDTNRGVDVHANTKGKVVARATSTDPSKRQEYYSYDVNIYDKENKPIVGLIIYEVEEEFLMAIDKD